jgi:hypothetical protein
MFRIILMNCTHCTSLIIHIQKALQTFFISWWSNCTIADNQLQTTSKLAPILLTVLFWFHDFHHSSFTKWSASLNICFHSFDIQRSCFIVWRVWCHVCMHVFFKYNDIKARCVICKVKHASRKTFPSSLPWSAPSYDLWNKFWHMFGMCSHFSYNTYQLVVMPLYPS